MPAIATSMSDSLQSLAGYIPFLIPLVLLQLGLQVYCLIKVVKDEVIDKNKKIIWLLIIIFGQLLGSIAYLFFGRSKEER